MRISVALASYNGEKYLRKQLDSIRLQTLVPDEVVVTDDGSTDATWSILENYQKTYPAFPLKIYKNEHNLGFRKNFREALKRCSGEIQFLCDQDDIWHHEKVKKMVRLFETHPEIQSVASSFSLIDGEDQSFVRRPRKGWSNQNLYHREVDADALVQVRLSEISFHNFCQGCALAFRAEVRERFLRLPESTLPHDWILNMIAAAEDGLFFYNVPLFQYRVHGANAMGLVVQASEEEKMDNEYRLLEGKQAMEFLQFCRENFSSAWEKTPELGERQHFLEVYLSAMQTNRPGELLKLAGNPFYHELKSKKGRLGDLAYAGLHKGKG